VTLKNFNNLTNEEERVLCNFIQIGEQRAQDLKTFGRDPEKAIASSLPLQIEESVYMGIVQNYVEGALFQIFTRQGSLILFGNYMLESDTEERIHYRDILSFILDGNHLKIACDNLEVKFSLKC